MIRVSSILFWFGLSIAASLGLYHTSYRVHELGQQLRDLNSSIEAEQQTLHVLKAEWVYLANPARVEAAARKHLAMRPTAPTQVVRLENLSDLLPPRDDAMASATVTGRPMPTVRTSLAMLTPSAVPVLHRKAETIDDSHINTHMTIERTASAQPLPNSIDDIMARIGNHP